MWACGANGIRLELRTMTAKKGDRAPAFAFRFQGCPLPVIADKEPRIDCYPFTRSRLQSRRFWDVDTLRRDTLRYPNACLLQDPLEDGRSETATTDLLFPDLSGSTSPPLTSHYPPWAAWIERGERGGVRREIPPRRREG